jgi:hypothetical protein
MYKHRVLLPAKNIKLIFEHPMDHRFSMWLTVAERILFEIYVGLD